EKPALSQQTRIKKEESRLKKIYKELDGQKQKVVDGLIIRAAFMRISLEDFEKDLSENGYIEKFSQGEQEPYDRKRPVSDLYNTMNAGYQKIIKQLTDLLPKDAPTERNDGFNDFVMGREDL
ncbi:MAG: hypothetical protein RR276_08860, partial [Angelakisella sp.]